MANNGIGELSESKRDAVLRRIQACFDLAKGAGTEEEAALAAARAHELLEKYNLSMVDVLNSSVECGEEKLEIGKMFEDSLNLTHAVCKLFDCKSYISSRWVGRTRKKSVVICGIPQNAAAAKMTFLYLQTTIYSMSMKYPGGFQRNSYWVGASRRILHRVDELKRQKEQFSDSKALVLVGTAIAERHVQEKCGGRVAAQPNYSWRDPSAMAAGYKDAGSIELNPGRNNVQQGANMKGYID